MKCFLVLLILAGLQAQVRDLNAEFKGGKTYITWTEEQGTTTTYNLYRSKTPITSVSGLTPVANIRDSSSYDFGWKRFHVIRDTAAPLSDSTGLFVYTPKETTDAYYAVTSVQGDVENTTLVSGDNALSSPVREEYWQWPLGVLREIRNQYEGPSYHFYYWMDYEDWNNDYIYYGDWYTVFGRPDDMARMAGGERMPLNVGLHSAWQDGYSAPPGHCCGTSGNGPGMGFRSHALPFNNQTWWYGWPKGWKYKNPPSDSSLADPVKGDTIVNYAEMRIQAYIHAALQMTQIKVDTDRIYMSGTSMGGSGTLINAVHFPDIFAAVEAQVPAVKFEYCWYFGSAANKYGAKADSLTARNGIYIYDWNDAAWMVGRNARKDFPVFLVSGGGNADGGMPLFMHRWFFRNCTKSKQAVFGLWEDIGHANATQAIHTSQGVQRFRRNEVVPVFTNASRDDNYGQYGPDTTIPPTGTVDFDSVGRINGYIDWTSSLHDMGLPNDSLIDSPDTLAMTFKVNNTPCLNCVHTNRESTLVDITPRRVQRFPVTEGLSYTWQNISTSTGAIIASGTATPDTNGLLTVPSFLILSTGSRLVITLEGGTPNEVVRASRTAGFSVSPNPFNASTLINLSCNAASVTVTDVRGVRVAGLAPRLGGFAWNAAGCPAGVYIVCVKTVKGEMLRKKVTLLK